MESSRSANTMQILFHTHDDHAELTLTGYDDATSLADVVERVVGRNAPAVVFVDGRVTPSSTSLGAAGVRTGSLVSLDQPVAPNDRATERSGDGVVELVQVAGLGAGRTRHLAEGRYAIGEGRRSNAVDLQLAPVRRAEFELEVRVHGECRVRADSGNVAIDGITLDARSRAFAGTLAAADRAFVLRRVGGRPAFVAPSGSGSTIPFNRAPRASATVTSVALQVPDGGGSVRERRQFPALALLAPVPVAIGMAVLMHRPQMLLFGLLSPVMMIANWIEDGRGRRRELVTSSRADAVAEARFRDDVRRAHTTARTAARHAHPDIAELIHRALEAAPSLWERRPASDDAWQVPIGLADLPWEPDVQRGHGAIASADDIVAEAGPLAAVPVIADLGRHRAVSVVGPSGSTGAVARGIVLAAATLHGPADLDVVVCTDGSRAAEWEWAKWLPHARHQASPHIFTRRDQVVQWAAGIRNVTGRRDRNDRPQHLTLVVTDVVDLWHDRGAPLRPILAETWLPVRLIAITGEARLAPAICTTVISARRRARAPATVTVDDTLTHRRFTARPFAVDHDLAAATARALAPLDDADLRASNGVALPAQQTILDLLAIGAPTPTHVVERWSAARRPRRPRARIGVGENGPLDIDLVEDGPHGLIAGTTGAGKSELLRSLVVSLALALPPDDLNFVLVDFKGGSAFDACADLPHTVGLVTDLDEHLAGRVLRCLGAELHHRERRLRDAGATSLDDYQCLDDVDPLPRLVLVVDEFASVAAELPAFLPSLVDIAQRGRSLGIHMILATQRPAGVVDAKIKANTNLRIALRVQDDSDSLDVIGTPDAAELPRHLPGRGYARFGAGEVVQFQSAYATGASCDDETSLTVVPWVCARSLTPAEARLAADQARRDAMAPSSHDGTPSDLDRLVAAIRTAAAGLGQTDQRRPYPDALPTIVSAADLPRSTDEHPRGAPFALVDLPDEQRQVVRWWRPGAEGSLAIYGVSGAGTSSLLATLALGAAQRCSPDELHLYVIDADTNLLGPLSALPHCGATVGVDDLHHVARLCRTLTDEVVRRKRLAIELGGPRAILDAEPAIALLIDNVGALRQAFEDHRELHSTWGTLEQLIRDGQGLGVCTVVTAKHERALPSAVAGQFRHRLVMRLGDVAAYTSFGFRSADVPAFVPGRALDPSDQSELQVACPPTPLADAIADVARSHRRPAARPPARVDALPRIVTFDRVSGVSQAESRGIAVAVGLDTSTATPARLHLDDGGAAFVTGPSRSGRSSMLAVIAASALQALPGLPVFAVCPRGGPLSRVAGLAAVATEPADVAPLVERVLAMPARRLLLIDDADRMAGPSFEALAAHDHAHLIVVAAGRSDDLRSVVHWSKPLQRTRSGVLLRPAPSDGDLFKVQLPLRLPRFADGHGYLVDDGDLVPLLAAHLPACIGEERQ